ncbi:MAG: DMT family transporter [Gammaproteobacteria bacterium]|nr:DMT family transporter [Gammaproteobacteria bacterium]
MQTIESARARYRLHNVRWGFYWALWCAVLWGAWYVPGTAVWYETPFVELGAGSLGEFLLAAAVITALGSLAVLLFLFVWTAALEKWGEYARTIRQFRIARWYYLGAVFGGPCALFGSYLAIGYVGPIFAAIAALMYPVVGATLARLWYHEKISARAALGIGLILVGGFSIYAPGLLGELSRPDSGAWLGYVGGLMAAVGWGVEGAIAGRALDVSDPDVGITLRFTGEAFYWIFLILPAIALFSGAEVMPVVLAAFSFPAMLWILLAGASFAFCYVGWYKSFPLIGVGRGQAIAALYGVFAVIFLSIFTLDLPEWHFLIGLTLTVFGGFVMFTEKAEMLEVIRSSDLTEVGDA